MLLNIAVPPIRVIADNPALYTLNLGPVASPHLNPGGRRGAAPTPVARRVHDERGSQVVNHGSPLINPIAVVSTNIATDRQRITPHLTRRECRVSPRCRLSLKLSCLLGSQQSLIGLVLWPL